MKIQIEQAKLLVGDLEANSQRIINSFSESNADLVVFPELALTGYPPQDLLFREYFLRECEALLEKIRKASLQSGVAILFGAPYREGDVLYNAAYICHKGSLEIVHKKHFLPNYGVFDEKRYFESAPLENIKSFKINNFDQKILCLICEDQWHDEMRNAISDISFDLIISLNASPFDYAKQHKREKMISKYCRQYNVPYFYANIVGGQDEVVFDGASLVFNGNGEIVKRLVACDEDQEVIDLNSLSDLKVLDNTANGFDCKNSYEAICLAIRDYVQKNGFSKLYLGLSGGIDSALCTALAADSLGAENLTVVKLPSRYTSEQSYEDANYLIEKINCKELEISIEKPFKAILEDLSVPFAGKEVDITEQNIQSRLRGNILMALANKFEALVFTTGNKSEYACGYATIYGDMCGAFAPIKDLYKSEVYKLAKWRNENIPDKSLCNVKGVFNDSVLTKAPTAELAPNQKDSDSLPEYGILDEILRLYIENRNSAEQIANKGYKESDIKKVINLIKISEYKRQQAAIGPKISFCSFDKDWRYPITNSYDK